MNNTLDKFEQKLNLLAVSSKVNKAQNQKLGYIPTSPKKQAIAAETPKKRLLTSKPKPYMPANNSKFEGQCPLDYGRIKKIHTNELSSNTFAKKNSTLNLSTPQHSKSL